jgi:hypothetical protein
MILIIKSFRQILRNQKDKDYKPHGKRACFKCGKVGHCIANYTYADDDDDREEDKKGNNKVEKKSFKKMRGETHIDKE